MPAMREPTCGATCDPDQGLVFRRGKLRKREDDEVRMMREALANLDDVPRVGRILLELGRFYNPVTNRPVVSAETRRAVLMRLDAADRDGAREVLDAHLGEYLKMDTPPSGPAEGWHDVPRGTL
jgi:hypothetical protein